MGDLGLKLDPKKLRNHVLDMAFNGQSVHIGCAFSIIEIVATLYSSFLKIDNPHDTDRDYLVLSKGHGVMALYAAFCEKGWLPKSALDNYFRDGSSLRGLAESDIEGIEVTSGSLGHGYPVAVGIAYGMKRKNSKRRVYCIVGDGEMNEGSIWEAMLFAAHHKLDNLVLIVDSNQYQAMGKIEEVLSLQPLADKFKSFAFDVKSCDGHSMSEIENSLKSLDRTKPGALIANTVKGKGVSFMEGNNVWHYSRLEEKTYQLAKEELLK